MANVQGDAARVGNMFSWQSHQLRMPVGMCDFAGVTVGRPFRGLRREEKMCWRE